MKKIVPLLLLAAAPSLFAQNPDAEALYEKTCTQCHGMEGYVWKRSFKAWQACVYTMQEYAYNEEFTDEVADTIIDFLVENDARIERELAGLPAEPTAVPTNTMSAQVAEKPPALRAGFGTAAKVSGYFGAGALLCAAGSGLNRRKLKKKFQIIHRAAAGALLATVLFHSVYYLSTFGTPALLWFRAGICATALLLVHELAALFRRRFRRVFLKVHIAGAAIGLTATVVHWLRIYI